MPECVEVCIMRDQLSKEFEGQTLYGINIIGGRYLKEPIKKFDQLIFPLHNVSFHRKGKFMWWQFNEEEVFFLTMGMSGSFGPRSKHSAIEFDFDNNLLYFTDIRRFGTFKIANWIELNKKLDTLGWDILTELIPHNLLDIVRQHNNKTVAELLMNQNIQSGIGNYIKNEACYQAKILPMRQVATLTDQEIISLYNEVVKVAKLSYEKGGATIKTFADLYGNSGKFFDDFQIYGKKKDPFGNIVKHITTKDKRTSFYVEGIQK